MKLSFYLHKYHNYDRDRIQVKTRRVTKKLVTLLSFAYLKDSFIYLNKKYYIIFLTIKHPLSDYLTGFIDCSNKPLTDAVYE